MKMQEKRGVKLKGGSILQSLYETVTILYGKTVPSLPPSGIFIYLYIDTRSKKIIHNYHYNIFYLGLLCKTKNR